VFSPPAAPPGGVAPPGSPRGDPSGPRPRGGPAFATVLFALLVLTAAPPLALLGLTQVERSDARARELADLQAHHRAAELSNHLEQRLDGQLRTLEALASTLRALDSWDPLLVNALVEQTRRDHAGFRALQVHPRAEAHAPPAWPGVSAPGPADGEGPLELTLTVPIFNDEGRSIGEVEGAVPLRELLGEVAEPGPGQRVILFDGAERVLYDSRASLPVLAAGDTLPVLAGIRAGGGQATGVDERGDEVRAVRGLARVGAQRWSVMIAVPQATMDELASGARRGALQAAGFALLLAIVLSGAATRLTSQGIGAVARRVAALGRGEVPEAPRNMPVFTPREMRDLFEVLEQAGRMLISTLRRSQRLVEQVKDANAQLRPMATAWEQVGDGVEITDLRGVVRVTNPAMRALRGFDGVGATSALFSPEVGVSPSAGALRALLRAGETWRGTRALHRGDELLWADVTASPLREGQGEIDGLVIIWRDVTEHRRAEETARTSERLASLGVLAAGVAHEVNNPLTYIVGNLSVIEELVGAPDGPEPADLPDLRAATREALQGVQKVANITKSLLSLARSDTGTLGPVEMGAVIEACVRVAANEIRHRARLELQLQPVPTLWANEGELSQVVLNLLLNAAHAIPSGQAAQNTITVRCKVDGGDVLVQVEDTGAGIPARILGRIFEPFFTTKDVGTGTGLGLAVSRRLIQDLGGTIQVHSELGRGTCFDVRLPIPEALGRSLTPPTVQQAPRMRVLVVDDDPLVARALERMLAGHEVMLAVGGQDALAQLEGGLHPDAILSDLMMPEMTGLQLHAAVEARWPELGGRFVLVTGGAFGGDIAEALARADLPQITKPVDRVELAALLASLAPRRAP